MNKKQQLIKKEKNPVKRTQAKKTTKKYKYIYVYIYIYRFINKVHLPHVTGLKILNFRSIEMVIPMSVRLEIGRLTWGAPCQWSQNIE